MATLTYITTFEKPSLDSCIYMYTELCSIACSEREIGGNICTTSPPACMEGAILLMNRVSISQREGRVEVCMNNKYTSVCNLFFDEMEAQVVCDQLGFPSPATSK